MSTIGPVHGERVGFIGPGQMGRPMVERLLAAGTPVCVHARRAEVRAELEAAGAEVVEHAAEAMARSSVVICCLFSDAQLRSVLLDDGALGAARPGTLVLDHVTGSPALLDELVAAAPEGVQVIDAPVSGTADQIRAGTLTVMLGGPDEVVERARPVLAAYADPILALGPLGVALRVKLVNNVLFAANLRLAADAQRIARALDVELDVLARGVGRSSGATTALAIVGGHEVATVEQGARPFLEKDVAVVEGVAHELGLDLGELGRLASHYTGAS